MQKSYDFTSVVNRTGTGSIKWDMMQRCHPGNLDGIVPLSVGDMELKSPPELIDSLKQYVDTRILGYTAPTEADKMATVNWFARRHNWQVRPEWLMSIDGIVPALYLMVRTLTSPGQGVVYMPPVYRPLYNAIADNDRTPVAVPLVIQDGGYAMDYAALENAVSRPEVTLLLLCSPHNPVSRVWRREELTRLGEICRKHGVFVIADEIHMDFAMPGYKHVPFSEAGDGFAQQGIICTAPSKTFNIAGLQTSNLIIPDEKIRRKLLKAHQLTGRHGANQLGLAACRLAYDHCEDWLNALLELLATNEQILTEFMREHYPEVTVHRHEGTYFLWADFRSWGKSTTELEQFMTSRARLFLDEGYIFGEGGEGFERFNIACPTWVLQDALERLRQAGRP